MTNHDDCHKLDLWGLFLIAALCVSVLGLIVFGSFYSERGGKEHIDASLLGAIGAGLVLFLRDIVQAVKARWEERTRERTNEQLARSTPSSDGPVPEDAAAAAERVAEAADTEAEAITGASR